MPTSNPWRASTLSTNHRVTRRVIHDSAEISVMTVQQLEQGELAAGDARVEEHADTCQEVNNRLHAVVTRVVRGLPN
jgi:hypothetical protein